MILTSIAPSSESSANASRDKRFVFACLGIVALVAVMVAAIAPREGDDNPTPSSYASTSHGAKAAYLTLAEAGYRMERWERPLGELAAESDSHTVLILAEPWSSGTEARSAIKTILERGGRVLATGINGGALLPEGEVQLNAGFTAKYDCPAQPEGFDALASSGTPHFNPVARWNAIQPDQRAEYYCGSSAVVVTYPVGQGTAVWWASSMPLENASIARDGDLSLLLSSIGRDPQARIIWDESLHQVPSAGIWSYANGTPVHLLWLQLALVAGLLVMSFSRRSGPLVPDPAVRRDRPLEFVSSLGALYEKADASQVAVRAASDRFRLSVGRMLRGGDREELISIANARAGRSLDGLRETLTECDEVEGAAAGKLSPRRALRLAQKLWAYEHEIRGVHMQLHPTTPRRKTK